MFVQRETSPDEFKLELFAQALEARNASRFQHCKTLAYDGRSPSGVQFNQLDCPLTDKIVLGGSYGSLSVCIYGTIDEQSRRKAEKAPSSRERSSGASRANETESDKPAPMEQESPKVPVSPPPKSETILTEADREPDAVSVSSEVTPAVEDAAQPEVEAEEPGSLMSFLCEDNEELTVLSKFYSPDACSLAPTLDKLRGVDRTWC